MIQGEQKYLEIQVDNDGIIITTENIEKAYFDFQKLSSDYIITKIYDGVSTDVTYDDEKNCFKVFMTEAETTELDGDCAWQVRIKYNNATKLLTYKEVINVPDEIVTEEIMGE